MITQCKNCAGQLVFDPGKQKLVCSKCASEFRPEEFSSSEKGHLWDVKAESLNDVIGTDSEELMDCYVYTCSSCGGEIIINGSEASTKCIFCGNSAVVFNRIAKQKRPRYIIPFKITKDEAMSIIHKRFDKGVFVPKSIKNFKPENVRGIYIPYWLVNCDHKEAALIAGVISRGKSTRVAYYLRSGHLKLNDLPVDASKMLSDESSERLEPYDLTELKAFHEDYLLGFYSNISDIEYPDLIKAAENRAKGYFDEKVRRSIEDTNQTNVKESEYVTTIDYGSLRYAMFPAWFVTYDHKGRHNTVMVNGQTGKIVCGVPWNRALFDWLMILTGTLLSTGLIFLLMNILPRFFTPEQMADAPDFRTVIFAVCVAVFLFSTGAAKVKNVVKSISLTQSGDIFSFVKKRQE